MAPIRVVNITASSEPSQAEQARFRSFAERYVIARAVTFTVGKESEDAWVAMLDARRFYKMIERQGKNLNAFIAETEKASFDLPLY